MWTEFDRLRSLWSKRREAIGGTAALAGFRYQFAASLLEMARAGVSTDRARIFVETLSDITSVDATYVVVTQAKTTLRSDTLDKALQELWSIDELARAETPELAQRLRYRVLTSKQVLKDVEGALSRWPAADGVGAVGRRDFLSRVAVCVEADPEAALAAHLVNAFEDPDPFGTIETWFGRLLSQPTSVGFSESTRRIAESLHGLHAAAREREHRFHIWTESDHAPDGPRLELNPEKATLTGQTPRRSHLAEGRFARRSLYSRIHARLEIWLEALESHDDARLPVFWIAGRSGTGKSVALLHLLSDLHAADDQRVIVWLERRAERVAEAIAWARPFFAQGRSVIFAADDPYTPERHQRVEAAINDALMALDGVGEAYPQLKRPVVIFCGPTEQAENFSRDLADEVIIETYPIPPETEGDIEELRRWYKLRTGREDLPVGKVGDILIVQLFFEWATGQPLPEFAARLRKRLEAMGPTGSTHDVFDLVAGVLALNRLYVLFPADALRKELEADVELGTAFDRLQHEEHHLSFDPEGEGYRITHPHLANALYTAWFGQPSDARRRKAHLRRGFEAALSHGESSWRRLAPLWAVSRLAADKTASHGDAVARLGLIASELKELLTELYAERFLALANPLGALPVWCDLNEILDLNLRPSPIVRIAAAADAAIETDAPGPGLRFVLLKLIEHRDRCEAAQRIVGSALAKFADWGSWSSLLCIFFDAFGSLDEAAPVARCFLLDHPNDSSWSHVWERLLAAEHEPEDLQTAGLTWLGSAPWYITGWDRVWEKLWAISPENNRELRELGLAWLGKATEHGSWVFVWRRIWQGPDGETSEHFARARQWLDEVRPDHESWGYLWRSDLLGAPDNLRDQDDLVARGIRWLDEISPGHGSWGWIWLKLLELASTAEESAILKRQANDWLGLTGPEHGSWDRVWQSMFQSFGDPDGQLLAKALRWIRAAPPEHHGWAFVWIDLVRNGHEGPENILRGRRWLDAAPAEHGGWGYVWRELWNRNKDNEIERDDLSARGFSWLEMPSLNNRGWPIVWNILWDAGAADSITLREIAERLLLSVEIRKPDSIVHRLYAVTKTEAVGRSWDWKDQWEREWLVTYGAQQRSLANSALAWLAEFDFGQGGWTSVWRKLWNDEPIRAQSETDLLSLAAKWLVRVEITHPRWADMWQILWTTKGKAETNVRDALARVARRWLLGVYITNWQLVWLDLWEVPELRDQQLAELGRWRVKIEAEGSAAVARALSDWAFSSGSAFIRLSMQ